MNQGSVLIGDLMRESGVGFGTSGARGLAEDMTDAVCYAYTRGFLQYLRDSAGLPPGGEVGLAGDFRPSTSRILEACARAVRDSDCQPLHCGRIPSPAIAAFGLQQGIPTLMVTGSHIPDDRNGIKFNTARGEILKEDEAGIREQRVEIPAHLFNDEGGLRETGALPSVDTAATEAYAARYLDFLPSGILAGRRIGLYEHSTVAAAPFRRVLAALGAEVTRLGPSETFIPVDTEAIRPEDVELARKWAAGGRFDAIVSADGDGDRPLVSDERGEWLRGDVAGILCARFLKADTVVAPVSCNTALEKSGWFPHTLRTRIGSPYVIAGMNEALADGRAPVVGYEANGGFLTASAIERDGRSLPALPTRDALIVVLAVLLLADHQPVSSLLGELPPRYTASDRLKAFPTALSQARIAALHSGDFEQDRTAIEALFGADFGEVAAIDTTDGLRITFASGEIAHLRPSGNAPELRAYTEADTPERAAAINRRCLEILEGWRP